ncbi:MAG: hypothetical protein ACYCVH_01565 [Ignavibacteriaceae bacterium]
MKKLKLFVLSFNAAVILLLIIFLNGCSNHVGPQSENFSISFTSGRQLAKTASDSLVITSAKILIKDLKLKGNYTDTTHSEGMNDEDEVELKAGPFVVSLNLNGTVNTVAVNNIPTGVYYGVKFQIHKLNGNEIPPDSEFASGPGEDERYSVVVKGFFNGTPFVYKSRMTAEQEVKFQNLVTVKAISFINVTLVVDPNTWFYFEGHYLDPNNSNNSLMIDQLIKASFKKGFEDDHKDGHED